LAPLGTDATFEYISFIIKVTRIGELETLPVDTSVFAIATRRHNLEDGILHGHRRENIKY
jgi:hypothetical protein